MWKEAKGAKRERYQPSDRSVHHVISFHRSRIISESPERAITKDSCSISDRRRMELCSIRDVCGARLSRRRARSFGKAVKPVKSTKVASMTLGFSWSDAGRTYSRRRRAPGRKEGRSRSTLRESHVSGRNGASRENETAERPPCASSGRERKRGGRRRMTEDQRERKREREGEASNRTGSSAWW